MDNSTAAANCVWDDTDCQWELWGSKLLDVVYISVPLSQWSNIFIIIWTLMLAFSTKMAFSAPFLQYDKSTKAQRVLRKNARKEELLKAREARKRLKKAQRAVLSLTRLKSLPKVAEAAAASTSETTTAQPETGETKDSKADAVQEAAPATVTAADEIELQDMTDKSSTGAITKALAEADEEIPVFSSFDHQIVDADNKAMSVVFGSFVLSLMYAASGSRIPLDYSDDPLLSLVSFLTFSMIGYFLLCLVIVVSSKILLFKVNVRKELLKGNLSVAVTMAGVCGATAINLRVSLMGYESVTFAETLGVTVLFFVLGQVGVIFFGFIFQLVTAYDDQEEALKGNVAAGIKWAGNLVSLAIISSSPIKKSSELASFGTFFGIGGVFLIVFDQIISRLLIPGKLNEEISRDQNWGFALIAAAIMLSTSLAVDALLFDMPCPGSVAFELYEASIVVQPDE